MVDDANGNVLADYRSEGPTRETTEKMNKCGWSDVDNQTEGSLAYHKTKWHMIACEEHGHGSLKHLKRMTTQKLRINNWTGAPTILKYSLTDEPNKGLGFHLCRTATNTTKTSTRTTQSDRCAIMLPQQTSQSQNRKPTKQ
jgi:hypothetical protein